MKKLTTLLLVLLIMTLTGCGKRQEDSRLINSVNILTKQFEQLQEKYDNLHSENDSLKDMNNILTSDNARLKQQLEDISSESKSEDQKTIDNLNSQITDLKKQLEDAYNSPNSTYPELQSKINTLSLDLQNYKDLAKTAQEQVKHLQNQLAGQGNNDSYLKVKFWSDGNTYTSNVTWYSDPNCTKSIGNTITIISCVISEDRLSNSYTVYTCMSSEGLVYSSEYPYLTKN